MDLNDFNYVHIGNDYISKDLWVNIINDGNRTKPIGGLWTSPFNNVEGSISDWSDLLLETPRLLYGHSCDKGCLLKINAKSNICDFSNSQEVQRIIQMHNMLKSIDYEKLSTLYDGVFVSPYALSYQLRHGLFENWDVRTLLIFNLDIIESYMPITIEQRDVFFIAEMGTINTVGNFSRNYNYLCNLVNQLFEKELQNISYVNSYELKQKIIISEHKVYSSILKQIDFKINPKFDNFDIIRAALLNERHKQYVKIKNTSMVK